MNWIALGAVLGAGSLAAFTDWLFMINGAGAAAGFVLPLD